MLATWQPETHEDIKWLEDDCDAFNSGVDLDWLEHCPGCQEVTLDVQEVHEDGRQTTGALRITQAHAANKLGLTVPELLEKFKLD